MFEIDQDHIASLDEEALRELVGRLCEAELESQSRPLSAVTRGGHQNASDGGLDVRVALPPDSAPGDFIPRGDTGFQVKRTDMPASAITSEMRPPSTLRVRPVIADLAEKSGAYIIVSSQGSVADFALKNRIDAMAAALVDVPEGSHLKVDFYDRVRLATWVRKYPGLIPWVRERAKSPLSGWQSFAPWSGDNNTVLEYLQEPTLRIRTAHHDDGEGLSPADGIERLREILRLSGKVVRLVGLSGVGKTRLAQALFDERIGNNSLDKSSVAYTNMADSPEPTPIDLITNLNQAKKRAIVVVDNCPPDLHRRIAKSCQQTGSSVSSLTIEYDVREDEPEGTEVFHLEPASVELIERLVRIRRPDVSQVDARTIAEFSGGNARIAFALTKTVETNGTVAGLRDEELFQRLFRQRHADDADLLLMAEACSTVYSFDGVDVSTDRSELAILGGLVGRSSIDAYRAMAELAERDLLQARGNWRAILPHAIATRLAARALKKIPLALVNDQMIHGPSDRIRKSFSRRLGFLHESAEARTLAASWLEKDGILGDVARLDNTQLTMFRNIAPVVPESVLGAISRSLYQATSDLAPKFVDIFDTIRSIAYDPSTFEMAVEAMASIFHLAKEDSERLEHKVQSLFFIYLSGTHAPIDLRLATISKLINSGADHKASLGLQALNAALEATHFSADWAFEFGSRSRDYGYWPRTRAEIKYWFTAALDVARSLALQNTKLGNKTADTLAAKLRGLWSIPELHDTIVKLCTEISSARHWPAGWIALRKAIEYDAKDMTSESLTRLIALQKSLAPINLFDRVQTIVFDQNYDYYDDSTDDLQKAFEATETIAQHMGREAADDFETLSRVLPDLVTTAGRVFSFAKGLAEASAEPDVIWNTLISEFAQSPADKQRTESLTGFLCGLEERHSALQSELLDSAVTDDRTASWFPLLQAATCLDDIALRRIEQSLTLKKAPIARFVALSGGRATLPISDIRLATLLGLLNDQPQGKDVAINILAMHIFGNKNQILSEDVKSIGQKLLANFSFEDKDGLRDHRLAIVVNACLQDSAYEEQAQDLMIRLVATSSTLNIRASGFYDSVAAIAKLHPKSVLDVFLLGKGTTAQEGLRALRSIVRGRQNPLQGMPAQDVLSWCNESPADRIPLTAEVMPMTEQRDNQLMWTDVAIQLLAQAPDRCEVLKKISCDFYPSNGWSGSLVPRLERFIHLLSELETCDDAAFAACIVEQQTALSEMIEQQRIFEQKHQRQRDETFE